MMPETLDSLRYPIGKFVKPATITSAQMEEWIEAIAQFPEALASEVAGLSEAELRWPYRLEGWTIQQVVHHCADSHMNCLMRFKLALTEDQPTIRPYEEALWAQLADTTESPIAWSLQLLDGLHKKWVFLLKKMTEEDFERTFIHPEHGKSFSLKEALGMYAWHSNHHLAHVRQAKKHQGKF
jgi:hypothetical protein